MNHLSKERSSWSWSALAFAALTFACVTPPAARAQDDAARYHAIIAAPDRSDADRQNDQRRHAEQLLAFTGAKPGMRVLDMGAGAGYSTELLARAVAPNGVVYGQDAPDVKGKKGDNLFMQRLATPGMKNAVRDLRPYNDPIGPDMGKLDLITFFFAYHDTTYMDVDRALMDKKLFEGLKPGGILVVADHSARPGDGASVGKKFHRIEEATLRKEVEAAGFHQIAEGDFLRHPEDPRDVSVFKTKLPIDEFVLKFQRPM